MPEPIRLKIAYQRAESALGEFTRSVSRRTVSLRSPKQVTPGTEFVFELSAPGVSTPVEVRGKVERVIPLGHEFVISVRYEPTERREGVELALAQLQRAHAAEKNRAHLRVPLNLPAQSLLPNAPMFVIRDVSKGGMGVSVEAAELPSVIAPGELVLAEIATGSEIVALYGSVVWISRGSGNAARPVFPEFGVRFGKLRPGAVVQLERLLALKVLPPNPMQARLSFGKEAMARMP